MEFFEDKYAATINGDTFFIEVEGYRSEDQFDLDSYFVNLKDVKVYDDSGFDVTKDHPDYDDVINNVLERYHE